MKMLGVEQLLIVFRAVCLAYIGICIRQGYKKTEDQKKKSKKTQVTWSLLGVLAFVFSLLVILYVVVLLLDFFPKFEVMCRLLLKETLEMMSKNKKGPAFHGIERVSVCSLTVHVLLKVCAQELYLFNAIYEKEMNFLKWVGQHCMNLIAVLGFYYAVFYESNAELLNQSNRFLMALACFVFLELVLWDVFNFATNTAEKLGEMLALLRKSIKREHWFRNWLELILFREVCPCSIREGQCCCHEVVTQPDKTEKDSVGSTSKMEKIRAIVSLTDIISNCKSKCEKSEPEKKQKVPSVEDKNKGNVGKVEKT